MAIHIRCREGLGEGSFTPFDTGALGRGYLGPCQPGEPFAMPERAQRLKEHCGRLSDVPEFAQHYIAAHFKAVKAYVTRPQRSLPDFEPYHGLEAADGDRRAWTGEVRVHEPVSLRPEAGHIVAIALANRALLADVHDELLGHVKFLPQDDDADVDLAQESARLVLEGGD